MGNTYSKTSTSRDIAEKDNLGIDAAIRAATERCKAWRDNPQSLLDGLPRPVAPKPSMLERGGLALQAGIQAGAKTPYESGWANLLSGIGTGIQSGMGYDALMQQQQAQAAQQELAMRQTEIDMLPVDTVAPQLVEAFPAISGMPMNMVPKMNAVIASMQKDTPISFGTAALLKQLHPDLTDAQIASLREDEASEYVKLFGRQTATTQMIEEGFAKRTLAERGYTEEEIKGALPTIVGKPITMLSQQYFPMKKRAARRVVEYDEGKENAFGIVVRMTGEDKLTGTRINEPIKENQALTKELVGIKKGYGMIDNLYKNFDKLSLNEKREFGKWLHEEGFGDGDVSADNGAGFIQRIKGNLYKALARPAFAGEKGERLRSFITVVEATIPMVARSLGHTGVLTELDVIKSFGITPDPMGTVLENKERRRLYNSLVRNSVDALVSGYAPLFGYEINMNKLYGQFGMEYNDGGETETPNRQVDNQAAAVGGGQGIITSTDAYNKWKALRGGK